MRSFASRFSTAETPQTFCQHESSMQTANAEKPDASSPSPYGHQLDTCTVSCSEPLTNDRRFCCSPNRKVPLLCTVTLSTPRTRPTRAQSGSVGHRLENDGTFFESGVLEARPRLHRKKTTALASVLSALEAEGVARSDQRILG